MAKLPSVQDLGARRRPSITGGVSRVAAGQAELAEEQGLAQISQTG